MKHIVSEFFQEKAGRRQQLTAPKPSRLMEILSSGKVLSCINCGAFTQKTKKRKRRSKEKWDNTCHKCNNKLFDMDKFTKYASMFSKWVRATYVKHVPGHYYDGHCQAPEPHMDIMFPWDYSANLSTAKTVDEVHKVAMLHLGVKADKLTQDKYCKTCGTRLLAWNHEYNGTLTGLIQDGMCSMARLLGTKKYVKLLSYEQRAEAEGVPVETLLTAENVALKKKVTARRRVQEVRFAPRPPQERIILNENAFNIEDFNFNFRPGRVIVNGEVGAMDVGIAEAIHDEEDHDG